MTRLLGSPSFRGRPSSVVTFDRGARFGHTGQDGRGLFAQLVRKSGTQRVESRDVGFSITDVDFDIADDAVLVTFTFCRG